jgi:hypothetical protein
MEGTTLTRQKAVPDLLASVYFGSGMLLKGPHVGVSAPSLRCYWEVVEP